MTVIMEKIEEPANPTVNQETRAKDNINWFELLYGQCQEGWLTVWNLPEKKTKWLHISHRKEALKYAGALAIRKKDVYFGIGLRDRQMGVTQRGGREDISCITCFWADIDVKDSAHAESELPASFEEAIELVNSFPLLPSIIVKSANGLHVYWLLKQPWYFSGAEDRKKAQSLMNQFQSLLIDKGKQKGWILDNTSDLARVLRIPGTYNYKKPENPVKVEILAYYEDRRYSPEEFEANIPTPIASKILMGDVATNNGDIQLVVDHCDFIQYCRDNATTLPERYWFAMISNLCQIPNGSKLIHQYSQPHPDYSEDETNEKIRRCQEKGLHNCECIQGKTVQFGGCPIGGCGVKAPAAMATSVVFKAKLLLRQLLQEVGEKVDSAFNKEYVSAFGVLKDRDKAEYGKVISQIKEAAGAKINIKHLEAAVDEQLKNADKQKPVNVFEGLLYEFTVPDTWVVTNEGIKYWAKDGKITVCSVPITIATRLKNADDNTEKVELLFKRDKKWQTIRAERSTIYSKNKIVELANYGLPVTSETAKDLVNYLAAVEATNDIPLVKTVSRLGWINDKEFIPGHSKVIIAVEGGNAKLASAFQPSGTLDEWVALVKPLRDAPLGRLVLSAGFAAPMMEPLRQRIFALHIWGDSRAGKSAAAKAALSVWGNPSEGMMTFNTTKVGLEQQVAFLSNLPLIIDEKQIVSDKQAFVESIMYMLSEGKGKTRGAKGGGLADYKSWKTLAITTGEHPISSDSSATGIKSRVLELHSQSVVPEEYGATLHQCLESIHGTAGPEFIRRLLEYSELQELYDSIRKKLQEAAPDLMGSHHGALALLATADVLVAEWFFGEAEDAAVKNCWAMLQVIVKQLETKDEADEATRAMLYFRSWFQENARNFDELTKYAYGWQPLEDENTVYVNSGTFSKSMAEGGFNGIRVKRDFLQRQWLIPYTNANGETKEYKNKRNLLNKNTTVVEIRMPLLV
jgi:uncharacterized protein (DUF927 family)